MDSGEAPLPWFFVLSLTVSDPPAPALAGAVSDAITRSGATSSLTIDTDAVAGAPTVYAALVRSVTVTDSDDSTSVSSMGATRTSTDGEPAGMIAEAGSAA